MNYRNRITEYKLLDRADLVPNDRNWRTHPEAQREALRGVLAEVGIADAVLARPLGDGRYELIDGHLRHEELPDKVPTLILDLDEAEGDKLLATLDPLAAMAEADSTRLDELLREVQTGSQAVADMLTELAEDAGIVDKETEPESSTEEINPDEFSMQCKCPRCGFEFDPPEQA